MMSNWQLTVHSVGQLLKRHKSICLVLILVLLDKAALNIVVPLMAFQLEQLGADATALGFLTSTFALTQLLSSPVFGWLSDRYGNARMMALSFIGSSCLYLLLGWAPNVFLYALIYIPVGFVRHAPSLAAAYITHSSLPSERTLYLSYLNMMTSIGFVMGPGIGGTLSEYDPTLPSVVCAAIFFVNFVLCALFLPDPSSSIDTRFFSELQQQPTTTNNNNTTNTNNQQQPHQQQQQQRQPLRIKIVDNNTHDDPEVAAPPSFAQLILEEEREHYKSAPPIVLLLSPSFLRTVKRRGIPYLLSFAKLYISGIIFHFRRYNLLFFLFNSFLSNLVYSIFMSAFPLIGKEQFGLTPKSNGMLMSYIGGLVVFAHLAIHFLSSNVSETSVILLGMTAMGASLVVLSFVTMVEMLLIFMVPVILCVGLLRTTFLSTITKKVPRSEVGTMIGMLKSVDSAARVLGPAIGGLLFQYQGPKGPGAVPGLVLLIAAGCTFFDLPSLASSSSARSIKVG